MIFRLEVSPFLFFFADKSEFRLPVVSIYIALFPTNTIYLSFALSLLLTALAVCLSLSRFSIYYIFRLDSGAHFDGNYRHM